MTRPEDSQPEARSDGAADEPDLLSSPIEKTYVNRLFVYGGPLGLAVAIMLSLWVSYWHVRHTAVVQVETAWRGGEQLAVRAQIVAERPTALPGAFGRVWLERQDQSYELADLQPAGKSGVLQGIFMAPDVASGPAQMHVRLGAEGVETMHEIIPIAIVDERPRREATPTVAGSTLQYGDDTDPQPVGMRIVVRPFGRILAGFVNTMLVRVTHPDGRPYHGPVEVVLADGEYMEHKGDPDDPPRLVQSSTDRLGLLVLEGPLMSEVVRFEVRVAERDDPAKVLHERRVRMVSYAGAVTLEVDPLVLSVRPGQELQPLEVHAYGLSSKRRVFVDVHGPDGAFAGTLEPFVGREPPRKWTPPALGEGLVQLEAYHFTNAPGESTAVAHVQLTSADPGDDAGLDVLIERQREQLDIPRVERDFDPKLERAYLDWLDKAQLQRDEVVAARRWLIGTLPTVVYGPPTALVTRQRETQALAARQRRWTIGLRIFLLGGGGLFLAAMTWSMMRAHARAATSTQRELEGLADEAAQQLVRDHVQRARRAALLRGLGVVAVMAGGLVLTTLMLESLVWIF